MLNGIRDFTERMLITQPDNNQDQQFKQREILLHDKTLISHYAGPTSRPV